VFWVTTEAPKNTERYFFYWKIKKAERPPQGLTATKGDQTASSSNGRRYELKVVVTLLAVWPWVALWSDREIRSIFPMARFWSVGYKYSSILCKRWLLSISIAYLTLESPLPSHTSIPCPLWVCEILVLDLSVLELCGTSDSSSKRHSLVTLGGCRILDCHTRFYAKTKYSSYAWPWINCSTHMAKSVHR
jgi:hypothetical protein